MSALLDRFRSMISDPAPTEAPDGTHDTLRSGKWTLSQSISAAAFPGELLLTETDIALFGRASDQVILAATQAGRHTIELLLWASSPQAVGLGLRIPTAPNQYKEPYLLMEAEAGNSREDAVREINFHLMGRVSEEDVRHVDWATYFRNAVGKLQALRALP
jgi:hypothetical protein